MNIRLHLPAPHSSDRDIAKNGTAGREAFFLGIDAVEEEAQRVEVILAERVIIASHCMCAEAKKHV